MELDIKNKYRSVVKTFFIIFIISVFTIIVMWVMNYYNLVPKEYYNASDFSIKVIYSGMDFNHNKNDDYSDFVIGARKDAKNHPRYVNKYYENGYPPDDEGVCTDVIWRAFKYAGYSLRDMVDQDIKRNPEDYPNIKVRDANIDFRRVINLQVFFEKYAIKLTNDYNEIEEWQPGDIVIFGEHEHIGIISDKRNKKGISYVIHNGNQLNREEDYLKRDKVTGHYRFDATLIDKEILVSWQEN